MSGSQFPFLVEVDRVRRDTESGVERAIAKALLIEGEELLRQSVLIILQTEPGERVMRPDFGCPLSSYVMQPNSPATRLAMQRDVETALALWEPRITVQRVAVEPTHDPSVVVISVQYENDVNGNEFEVAVAAAVGGIGS